MKGLISNYPTAGLALQEFLEKEELSSLSALSEVVSLDLDGFLSFFIPENDSVSELFFNL